MIEFSVLLHEFNSPATPWPSEVKINVILLKFIIQTSRNIPVSNHLHNFFFCLHQSDLLNWVREWHFSYLVNRCWYRSPISIDVLRKSVPDENLTKCTLLFQRSPQAPIDYHTKLFPPHLIHQTKHTTEQE